MRTHYRLKQGIFGRIARILGYILTISDILLFMYYSLLRNAVKEMRKMRVKQSKGIKRGADKPDFNSLLNTASKELDAHLKEVPFLLRLFPSFIIGTMIFFLIW